ncbi:MAG: hypothetical protein Q9221_007617 [Calogaya cf. arnoldii]
MSVPRLTFLYPHLFKPRRLREPIVVPRSFNESEHPSQRARISTTARRKQEAYPQRYGPAAEAQLPPPSQPPVPNDLGRDQSLAGAIEKEVKPPAPKQEEKKASEAPSKENTPAKDKKEAFPTAKSPITKQHATNLDASESHPKETLAVTQEPPTKALDTVLHRQTPDQSTPSEQKPPHLQAPPYIHHFDTFTMTSALQKGGFTQAQSVTLMKAVRGLLATNLDVARAGLISKSDVENETYLFRAACSELRTEISNARRTSQRTSATQLSHLTHEVEILSQRLTQESSALKDDLRGMLDDRRMAVRSEQQAIEQRIQELNYKITVGLTSNSKSEVEGLRWIVTRRAAMAIGFMALLILGSLRFVTYKMHVRDEERRIAADKAKASKTTSTSSGSGGSNFTVPSREMCTQTSGGTDTEAMSDTEAMLANVSQDGSPAYVSLG